MEKIMQELKRKIKESSLKKDLTKQEWELLISIINFIPTTSPFSMFKYLFLNDLTEIPKCEICNAPTKYIKSRLKFSVYCDDCRKNEKTKIKEISLRKQKQTCLEKYGVENCWQSNNSKEKIKKTNLKKYGHDFPSQSEEIKNRMKTTCLKKYGVENAMSSEMVQKKLKISRRESSFETFKSKLKNKQIILLSSKSDYLTFPETTLRFKCEQCNNEFEYTYDFDHLEIRLIYCPNHHISKFENEILTWINSLGLNIESQRKFYFENRRFKEIDIFIPDFNLGIECNGLYWHSNLFKDNNFHYEKWKFFNDLNIELIQIFENEWYDKQDIVKSIILNKLKRNKRIYGRKCVVKEITSSEYREFLIKNHIQDVASAKVKLGLFHENELVQVMSFSKSRFNKKFQWENIRTCTKTYSVVVGGFNKLLNYFIKNWNPDSIVSYVDLRYFNGKSYDTNGFVFSSISKPNYFYIKSGKLFNRIKFQKHKLKSLLNTFDENLSEKENMLRNNYIFICDAGNKLFVWRKK